jgi:hypothetical protein
MHSDHQKKVTSDEPFLTITCHWLMDEQEAPPDKHEASLSEGHALRRFDLFSVPHRYPGP